MYQLPWTSRWLQEAALRPGVSRQMMTCQMS